MYQPAEDPQLRVIEPLGEGGTAAVIRAYHQTLKREVAVKYDRSSAESDISAFPALIKREYELIGGYRFPGLVRPLGDPSPSYDRLVLEYCPGPTLDRVGRVDDARLGLNIISALALDLEFLRAAGLIHGDLKPQNVFLPEYWSQFRSGRLFFLRLSDLSLGRRLDEPESSRLGLGTVGYMAPETIRDRRTGVRSDLFALGVIAYQLLTGRHPFMDEDTEPVKVNSRVCEQRPVPLAELRSDLPEQLLEIVESLLAKDEGARPESAWEVCQVLSRAGADYPFVAALRPAFLIGRNTSYDALTDSLLNLSESETTHLANLTDEDARKLRLLLTTNFIRGKLVYDHGKFRFTDDIYWPGRMRAQAVARFSGATLTARKAAIATAVAGGLAAARRMELSEADDAGLLPRALPTLLLQYLRAGTIRRLSARLAPLADRHDAHDVAARLHQQAGNLEEAERCADLAAHELIRQDRASEAVALLRSLDRWAQITGREFQVRRALMLKGKILKDSGELDAAESTYRRVIELYGDRPQDKLLAETFKYLGDLHRLRQDREAALEALEKSLAVFGDLGDELEISHTLTNIGNVYWLGNDTRRALSHYRTAYKIQVRLDAKPDIASTLHNIASVFCLDGRLKRGIFLLNHTLDLKKEIGHAGEIARTLNNLGYAYQLAGSPARAADCLTESLAINQRIGSKKEVLYNIENLVALKIAAGQLTESLELLKEGLDLARSHNLAAHEGPFHLYVATIEKRMGRYGNAEKSLARVEKVLASLDDYSLGLLTDMQKAGIRLHLGDKTAAARIAERVCSEARRTRNAVAELESLLMLVRLADSPAYLEEANGIVEERHLVREKRLLRFGRLEYLLDQERTEDALAQSADLLNDLNQVEDDLELSWMYTLAASVWQIRGATDEVNRCLQVARRQAEAVGLAAEQITTLTALGRLAKAAGNYEEAYAALKKGLELCRLAAEGIDREADRQLFLAKPVVRTLAAEIKALGQRLGKKERADR